MSDLTKTSHSAPAASRRGSSTRKYRTSFLITRCSVIVSRALPDVRDGLKPVHRRVLYAMHEAGLQPNRPTRKSARVVGDVMGNYHPHGDSAIYDALVRLAQPFSMRYPLIDGQGTSGPSTATRPSNALHGMPALAHGDGAADANRRGHGRLRGQLRRVAAATRRLPARFPNLLVNGSSGIAVGMATNIPPHNLGEVVDAIVRDDRGTRRSTSRGSPSTSRARTSRPAAPSSARRHPRRVPLGAWAHLRSRTRAHRAASRRQERDHHHGASVRRAQGGRGRCDREDRRPRQWPERSPRFRCRTTRCRTTPTRKGCASTSS